MDFFESLFTGKGTSTLLRSGARTAFGFPSLVLGRALESCARPTTSGRRPSVAMAVVNHIFGRIWMTVFAVGGATRLGIGAISPQNVFASAYRLQMRWVNAPSIAAQMIQNHILRDRSNQNDVCPSVRIRSRSVVAYNSIPRGGATRTHPLPAFSRRLSHCRRKKQFQLNNSITPFHGLSITQIGVKCWTS